MTPPATVTLPAERGDKLARAGCVERVGGRTETARATPEVETATVEEWPLKTPPDRYLAQHPNGPKAELARRILGR